MSGDYLMDYYLAKWPYIEMEFTWRHVWEGIDFMASRPSPFGPHLSSFILLFLLPLLLPPSSPPRRRIPSWLSWREANGFILSLPPNPILNNELFFTSIDKTFINNKQLFALFFDGAVLKKFFTLPKLSWFYIKETQWHTYTCVTFEFGHRLQIQPPK